MNNNWTKMCPYVVVRFLEDDEKSEIPSNWLESENKCWWPPSKDIRPLIAKRIEPVKDKWKIFDIEVQEYCENYEKARKKAENLFASETEEEKGRGKRKKISKFPHVSSSDEEQQEVNEIMLESLPKFPDVVKPIKQPPTDTKKNAKPPTHLELENEDADQLDYDEAVAKNFLVLGKLPKFPDAVKAIKQPPTDSQKKAKQPPTLLDLENEDDAYQLDNDEAVPNASEQEKSENSEVNLEFIDITTVNLIKELKVYIHGEFGKVHRKLAYLQLTVGNLEKKILVIDRNQHSLQPDEINLPKLEQITNVLPLNSIESFTDFETDLHENEELKKLLLKYYLICGGSNIKDKVVRLLRKTFTNGTAAKTSWLGQRNNFKLCNTFTIATMKEAVSAPPEYNEKIFEDHARDWVRQAKQRYQREIGKETPQE